MVVKNPPSKPTNLRPYECDLVIEGQHLTKLEISPYYEKHNKEYLDKLEKEVLDAGLNENRGEGEHAS